MLKGAMAFNCWGVASAGAVYITPTAFSPSARALVENRPGSGVVDVLLLQAPIAVVRIVDFFAYFASGEKRLVAVAHGGFYVAVLGQNGGRSFKYFRGLRLITGC